MRRIAPVCFLFLTCLLGSALAAAQPDAPLRAGAAKTNITAPPGTPIIGGFAPFPRWRCTTSFIPAASC